jgi:hydroxymethylglutaryl-CoA reductase (NADPH)
MNKIHSLEQYSKTFLDAVIKRREHLGVPSRVPYQNFNYEKIYKKNCENVIGYVPIPIGYVGPLKINNNIHHVPIATTEGALVSSLNRGCKVLFKNGVNTIVEDVGMSRAPLIKVESIIKASEIKEWINNNLEDIERTFNNTTNYGKFKNIEVKQTGNYLHLRISASTGEAMGMNMLTKGSEKIVELIRSNFPSIKVLSLSGNFCTDKKNSSVNWILGRGKNVIAEALIDKDIIIKKLHTNMEDLIELNINKNLIGSNIAGSIGGFNSQAANVVAGIFIATGQDTGQIGTSSSCILNLEKYNENVLRATLTMPQLEVGIIGGGTNLSPQKELLDFMNLNTSSEYQNGNKSKKLAEIIATSVLAGEISLLSAMCSSDLVNAHMKLNR